MLRTNIIKRLIGIYTKRNDTTMRQYKSTNYQNLKLTLIKLNQGKQFIQLNGVAYSFIGKVQNFILNNNLPTNQIFEAYKLMKKMEFIESSFKHAIFSIFYKKLINDQNKVKNQQIESILWWMLNQCPYRVNQIMEVAQTKTIILFEIYQYMNEMKNLPFWQPYIRVAYILKYLGHQIKIRQDLFNIQNIQKNIQYRYIPTIAEFLTIQQASKHAKQQSLYTHYKNNLSRIYLTKANSQYDIYLHKVQKIDNQRQGQEIDRSYDVLDWNDLASFIKMVEDSLFLEQFDSDLQYQYHQLFWRKLQTQNIDIQNGTKILQILCRKQPDGQTYRMINRILQAILQGSIEQILFSSYTCLKQLFQVIKKLKFRDDFTKQFIKKASKSFSHIIKWDNLEDKQQLQNILKQLGISLKIQ